MAQEDRGNLFGSVLVIMALIALALVLLWGTFHLFSLSRGWLSSLWPSANGSALTVSAPSSVVAGEPFSISWKHASGTAATYALVYQCRAGLSFAIQANGADHDIPCGTAIGLAPNAMSVPLIAVLSSKAGSTTAAVSILLMEGTSSPRVLAQGGTTLTILPGTGIRPVSDTTRTGYDYAYGSEYEPAQQHTRGPADFSVEIVAVGMIDPSTGAFIPNGTPGPNDTAAIQFDIGNVGGTTSGPWSFMATLPTANGYVYTSPTQAPLPPGGHIMNTLRFTQIALGGGVATVRMQGHDGNVANDDDSRFVRSSTQAPQYTYPHYQQQYQQQYQPYQQQYEYLYPDQSGY